MPKLWNDTVESHRVAVRTAILDATAALVADRGLMAVTMSEIAEATGIGRATLYKYFSDVEAILLAWHEREIASHLAQLAEVRNRVPDAGERIAAVLEAYAFLAHRAHGHHDAGLAALLHHDAHVHQSEHNLHALLRELLAEAVAAGVVRADIAPDELAAYCLHALTAARGLKSAAAVRRLVSVTLAGLSAQSHPSSGGGQAPEPHHGHVPTRGHGHHQRPQKR